MEELSETLQNVRPAKTTPASDGITEGPIETTATDISVCPTETTATDVPVCPAETDVVGEPAQNMVAIEDTEMLQAVFRIRIIRRIV
jgi:hypothetical protein